MKRLSLKRLRELARESHSESIVAMATELLERREMDKLPLTTSERFVMMSAVGHPAKKEAESLRVYRNRFSTSKGSETDALWDGLVRRGLAAERKFDDSNDLFRLRHFYVTPKGFTALGMRGARESD